jgi:RNA polymerase II subunit A C-terminal domain phosphatase SSU72
MEAHLLLRESGYACESFGAGSKVRLPGEAINRPNVYDFGTPYADIHADLTKKNRALYTRNGMLNMFARNLKVKTSPERWQDELRQRFDVVVVFDKRAYDTMNRDLQERDALGAGSVVHLILMDTTDSHAEATVGAARCLTLVERLAAAADWRGELTAIMDSFTDEAGVDLAYQMYMY